MEQRSKLKLLKNNLLRFIFRYEKNYLLLCNYLFNKSLVLYIFRFNNESCGHAIGDILRSNFKGAWYSWEKIDSMCKDELFKEFKVRTNTNCHILFNFDHFNVAL